MDSWTRRDEPHRREWPYLWLPWVSSHLGNCPKSQHFWIIAFIVILLLYGGMLGGVFPGQPGISWQGHLFGFFAGILATRVMFSREKVSSR